MRTHFEMKSLVPCYSEEGRCKYCRVVCNDWLAVAMHAVWNMWGLRDFVLEPTRMKYGKPIRVLKCFMCQKKCKKLGLDEQFYLGEAAEITATHGARPKTEGADAYMRTENAKIGAIIQKLGGFDRLVYVNCDEAGRPEKLRVSYKRDAEANRGEVAYETEERSNGRPCGKPQGTVAILDGGTDEYNNK